MKPQTKKILLGVGVVAGVLAIVAYATSGEKVTSGSSAADIDRVVDHALKIETNSAVLHTFAAKLRAAGRLTQSQLLETRANALGRIQEVAPIDQSASKSFRQIMQGA